MTPRIWSRRSALALIGLSVVTGAGLAAGSELRTAPPAGGGELTRDDLVRAIEGGDAARTELPPGTYANTGEPVPLPEGHTVVAQPGTVIRGPGFTVPSGCRIEGVTFVSSGAPEEACLVSDTARSPADVTVTHCAFSSYHQAVALGSTTDGGGPARWTIANCTFRDCVTGVFQIVGNGNTISGNTFVSSRDDSQAIVFYGGQDNRIEANRIEYGITGVLLLANPSTGGVRGQFLRNAIVGNTVSRCSEEHISMDCHGNDPDNVAAFEQDAVATAGPGSEVVLAAAGWAGAGPAYAGYHMMINTGALAGRCTRIAAQTDARFTVELTPEETASIRPGDRIVIGSPFFENEVRDNVVDSTERGTTASIALYGLCYATTVTGNRCAGRDLRVQSLNSLVRPSVQYTGTPGMAPTEGNRIVGNTVSRGATVRLDYTDFGSAPPFVNHGNVVAENVLEDGAQLVLAQQQP